MAFAQPLFAERLSLSFLPPDLPPNNVCSAEAEVREEGELQDGDLEFSEEVSLEDEERLRLLSRDIRELTTDGAAEWTDYIEALIDWKADLDPDFAGIAADFERIALWIKAGRLAELKQGGLLTKIAADPSILSNAQKVEIARYLRTGLGIDRDQAAADALLVEAGFAGSAGALLAIVRLEMAGDPVQGWDLPLKDTATLAFGGLIGQVNRGLCGRAERMAREYLDGDILKPNTNLAYAWRVFAADMGGPRAAWRVVEHHLNGTAPSEDHEALLGYLNLAVANGFELGAAEASQLVDSGAVTEAALRVLLRRAPTAATSGRRSAAQYLELQVNPIGSGISTDSDLRRYLTEALLVPGAPAVMYTRMAREVLLRDGQWDGEAEAFDLLTRAVALGDPQAMVILARIQSRNVTEPAQLMAAENLLLDAVSRFDHPPAMKALDDVYRCRLPQAPMMFEANYWADAYRATGLAAVSISPSDAARLNTDLEPEVVAKIQSMAVLNHSGSKANLLQMLQSDPTVSETTLRYWASRVASSDNSLEDFVIQEFSLALDAGARTQAVSLFRRAYLEIGPAISLDLAVALVEHAGRDPVVAQEVRGLLERAAQRGEGAAIRLLQRLENMSASDAYVKYAAEIESRGDFLAMMLAAPFTSDAKFSEHMGRAVSMMNCGTKDAAELADAYATRGMNDEAIHWVRVGLAMAHGHLLSKLGLSDLQGDVFAQGLDASVIVGTDARNGLRRRYLEISHRATTAFDANSAADALIAMFEGEDDVLRAWAIVQYGAADWRVKEAVLKSFDVMQAIGQAANEGNSRAQFELAMLLRSDPNGLEDLVQSAVWLMGAAEAGHVEAMAEYGFALGLGLGVERDAKLALIWLAKAQSLGSTRAKDVAGMIRVMDVE